MISETLEGKEELLEGKEETLEVKEETLEGKEGLTKVEVTVPEDCELFWLARLWRESEMGESEILLTPRNIRSSKQLRDFERTSEDFEDFEADFEKELKTR
jgi:hypothetical protein